MYLSQNCSQLSWCKTLDFSSEGCEFESVSCNGYIICGKKCTPVFVQIEEWPVTCKGHVGAGYDSQEHG